MAATRNTSPESEPATTRASGFSEDERTELRDLIAEAVGSARPPEAKPGPTGPPPVTDKEWDDWTDRKRESWMREMVASILDDLDSKDTLRRHDDEIAALREAKTPEPESVPSTWSKIQRIIWGEREQ